MPRRTPGADGSGTPSCRIRRGLSTRRGHPSVGRVANVPQPMSWMGVSKSKTPVTLPPSNTQLYGAKSREQRSRRVRRKEATSRGQPGFRMLPTSHGVHGVGVLPNARLRQRRTSVAVGSWRHRHPRRSASPSDALSQQRSTLVRNKSDSFQVCEDRVDRCGMSTRRVRQLCQHGQHR